MVRIARLSLAVPLLLLLGAGPVAADTVPVVSGTYFSSFSETCSSTGGRQVCTATSLSAYPDGGMQTCLDMFTYSISPNGRQTFISDRYGCAPTAGALTVGSDYSVTLAPTDISLQTCAAHKRECTGSTTVTVSATDVLVGDVTQTTTRSTTVDGNCTYKSTIKDTSAQLAGTLTIDGSSLDESGSLDIFDVNETVRCK